MVLQVVLSNCNILVIKVLFLTVSACLWFLHIHYKQFCGFYAMRKVDFFLFSLVKRRVMVYTGVVVRP